MVFDRASEDADGPGEARPELHLHHGRTGGDAHAPQKEPPETRSRAECYDALRAADSGSDQGDETKPEDPRAPDNRSEQGSDSQYEANDERERGFGWDELDAENRPDLEAVRVTPEGRTHILDGDSKGGGGHRHGTGKPGKTEFPASWSDDKIIDTAKDVARQPDKPPTRQDSNDSWLCAGTRDSVEVSVVIERSGEILTSWPEPGGPGVVRNPKKGAS